MGGSNSKGLSGEHRREADRHARRKKNGFRDSGLERHRQNCVKQKKKLKHVEDPAKTRKTKIENIQKTNKKEAKGPMGLAENDIKNARKNLKHRA